MNVALDDQCTQFLLKLHEATRGDLGVQVSMHQIGAMIGLGRPDVDRVTSELMGWQLVEIRTLSGGIGITDEGVQTARKLGAGDAESGPEGTRLGQAPILNGEIRKCCEDLAARLKAGSDGFRLPFDAMSEFVADINTISAQLASPRPMTAVFRESFRGISELLKKSGAADKASEIDRFLG